jgi:hypothetical protein
MSCSAFCNACRKSADKGFLLVRSLSDKTAISRAKLFRRTVRRMFFAFPCKASTSLTACSRRPSLQSTHPSDKRLVWKARTMSSLWLGADTTADIAEAAVASPGSNEIRLFRGCCRTITHYLRIVEVRLEAEISPIKPFLSCVLLTVYRSVCVRRVKRVNVRGNHKIRDIDFASGLLSRPEIKLFTGVRFDWSNITPSWDNYRLSVRFELFVK